MNDRTAAGTRPDALAEAEARVHASRASLVRELVAQGARGARHDRGTNVCGTERPRALALFALDAIDAASDRHPAAATLHLACAAAQGALTPLSRRHPWALVGGAALAGAALVALVGARPWRAMLRPAVVGTVMVPWMGRLLPPLLRLALAAERPRRPDDPGARP